MKEDRNSAFVLGVLLLAMLYIVSPVDFIPDVIPVIGWLDDLAVGAGAGALAVRSMTR